MRQISRVCAAHRQSGVACSTRCSGKEVRSGLCELHVCAVLVQIKPTAFGRKLQGRAVFCSRCPVAKQKRSVELLDVDPAIICGRMPARAPSIGARLFRGRSRGDQQSISKSMSQVFQCLVNGTTSPDSTRIAGRASVGSLTPSIFWPTAARCEFRTCSRSAVVLSLPASSNRIWVK
jgi:hypothetical protein